MNKQHFNTFLVDDEPEVMADLRDKLKDFREVQVLGYCSKPQDATGEILRLQPDVVFLDIQMPAMNGFEVMESLDQSGFHPLVVFVTAFEKYAIEALHHTAFDYLLKPVDKSELARVIHKLHNTAANVDNQKMFKELIDKVNPKDRIKLATTGGFILLPAADILYIEADWNYADIYINDTTKHLVTINIGALEKMLPPAGFCRISRSIIINVNYLTRVNRIKRMAFLMKDGKEYTFKIPLLNIRKLEAKLE